jgi:hypothetical protein
MDDAARQSAVDEPDGRSRAEVAELYLLAVHCAGHVDEQVRVLAGGTLAAASWVMGWVEEAPWTRRRIHGPSLREVQTEYLAALEARQGAATRIEYANDTGVVDLLGFLVDPGQEPPWWTSTAAADQAAG